MLKTHTSQLQTIETIDDLEQFAPAATATSAQINDFIDLHCMLEESSPTRKLRVTRTLNERALECAEEYLDEPENVLSCPIDHTGNTKIESTPEQSWVIYSPLYAFVPHRENYAIAFNNSGTYLIEPIK